MRVTSKVDFPAPAAAVWPLLCDSQMTLPHRCPVFCLGTPRPVQCRLPDGVGEAGASRECMAVEGSVQQEITLWEPPHRLVFRMVGTDLCQRHVCAAVEERFELSSTPSGGTTVTRSTHVSMRPGPRRLPTPGVYVGLKSVHRYVFRNWRDTLMIAA
ncbi:MAG TPA: SRPBCC family protein [Actinomycetes bacterium]|jgi:uncharacterized protein YndB with AHSA1/START domain